MWQDWVLGAVQWVFALALVPTIKSCGQKPALPTGFLNTVGCVVVCVVFISLAMWCALIPTTLLAIEWGIITYQRYELDSITRPFEKNWMDTILLRD
jgi:hypothetical protein